MKAKSLFTAALAGMALCSCSTENDVDTSNNDDRVSLALNVSTKTISRAMEGGADISALDIQTMIIELYDVNKKKIVDKSLSASEIAAVMEPIPGLGDKSRIVMEGISKEALYAKIYAYQAQVQDVADLSVGVNNFQKGFEAVPFFISEGTTESPFDAATGLITINKSNSPAPGPSTDTGHEGHKIWTIEATMSAYLARFEVKGSITASNEDPISGGAAKPWAGIVVTGIYINNIKDKVADATPVLIEGNHQNWEQGDWATGHPYVKTSGSWSNMFDANTGQEAHATSNTALFAAANANNVAAYQIFPQGVANSGTPETNAAPHVIVRLLITPDKDVVDKEPYYAFITLRKFKVYRGSGNETVTNNYLNGVERGKIYRIDLNTLAALTPGDPDPDPESGTADLYVKVSIEHWTELYLRPEL